jgi:hypothetical protein
VDCANERLVLVLEGFQTGVNVVLQLAGDDSVEGDNEDVATIYSQAFGMEDPLDSAYKAERLPLPGPAMQRIVSASMLIRIGTSVPKTPWFHDCDI